MRTIILLVISALNSIPLFSAFSFKTLVSHFHRSIDLYRCSSFCSSGFACHSPQLLAELNEQKNIAGINGLMAFKLSDMNVTKTI